MNYANEGGSDVFELDGKNPAHRMQGQVPQLSHCASLPQQMREAKRWLVWKLIPNQDEAKKPRKVPFYVNQKARNGELDSPADIAKLATFSAAVDALGTGQYAGLGFALGVDGIGGYWQGIDLDHLSEHPELKPLAEGLPGYVEKSPSGNGLHAIGYGRDFRSLGSNKSGIEAYSRARFFTVTGERVGSGELCDLHDFVTHSLQELHTPPVESKSRAVVMHDIVSDDAYVDLRSALAYLRADDYHDWIAIGCALYSLGEQGRALWIEWSQTSEKYDAADASRVWDGLASDRTGYAAVFAKAQRAGWVNPRKGVAQSEDDLGTTGGECCSEPEPLRRATGSPEPYPLHALGAVLQPAAAAIQRVIQAPSAIIGGSLLAAASLAVQAQADVHIDGRVHPLSIWFLSVAESGERKSAVDGEAMRAAHEYEAALADTHALEIEKYTADLAEWEAKRDAAKGEAKKTKGEGLADQLCSLGPAPQPPLLPRVTAADFTAEGLFKLLSASRPSIGAFTDEAALVFGGHGMTKESVMRTAGTLCKLWDSGTLDRVRSGEGALKLYGRRLALHLLAQPVIAERALSDDVLSGQGFMARCLLAWPMGTAGTRTYCTESLRDDPAMQRLSVILLERHRQLLPLAVGDKQALQPRALELATEAKAVWIELHNAIEVEMRPEGRFTQVKPWASKTPEQALRIAGVLTLLEDVEATTITKETMERGVELARWHLYEAMRLAGTAVLSPEILDAEALLRWAQANDRQFVHSREVLQFGPNRIRERSTFQRAMAELVRAGWAVTVEGGMRLDGSHRRRVWRICESTDGSSDG